MVNFLIKFIFVFFLLIASQNQVPLHKTPGIAILVAMPIAN